MQTQSEYEQRLAEENAARATKQRNFRILAQNVANHLHGAILIPFKDSGEAAFDRYDGRAKIALVDGSVFVLSIELHDSKPSKIEVYGKWPEYRDATGTAHTVTPSDVATYEERQSGNVAPSIGVSSTKSAEQIARDISRRFLPDFSYWHGRCLARCNEATARNGTVKQRAEAFAAAYGRNERSLHLSDCGATVNCGNTDIRIQSDGVRFEPFYCSDEQAKQILAIMQTPKQAE